MLCIVTTNLKGKYFFWLYVQNLASSNTEKKLVENIKEELLMPLKERNNECDAALDEMMEKMTRLGSRIQLTL